ncbi:MAG: hypothetical protein E7662_06055 [Ruminococcaceae bacterium]|nr:hypothetical protein [Oscillospiraceae bacterium]
MKEYPVDLHRFQRSIDQLTAKPAEPGNILLYGSSFFTNWVNAKEQMLAASDGKYHVVNRGFGGATADELMYYYHKLVTPNAPSAIITRIGANDIHRGFTPAEAWDMTWRLLEFARADYPGIKLILFSVFDFRSATLERRPLYAEFNAFQKEYAEQTENVWYIDISEFFYENPENVGTFEGFRDVFRPDGLHLLEPAYVEFAAYLTKKLDGIL